MWMSRKYFDALHDDVIKLKHFPQTGPLCGEFTGSGEFPTQRVNNHEVGDLRRHDHYDVNVMYNSTVKFKVFLVIIHLITNSI